MKQQGLRILALGLAATLALGPAASASQALGTEIHTVNIPLAQGTDLTKQSLWSATYSDLRTERFMTYTPTAGVRPAVAYGEKITTRATLGDMAKTLEAQGKRVLGGLNGDYYVLSTGAPLGMVVTDGTLRSTPQYTNSWSLGFAENGTAFIGQPELSVTANFHDMTLAVSGGVNKVRTESGGYYLLTDEFASDTMNVSPGIDVILRPLDEDLGQTVEVDVKVKPESRATETAEPSETPAPSGTPAPSETAPATETPTAAESPAPAEATESPAPAEGETATDSGELTTEDLVPADATPERITATLTRTNVLKIGGRVTCEVVQTLHSTGKIQIPAGCFVLTVNSKGNQWLVEQLAALTAGERVELDVVSEDPRWKDAESAIGGMYKLVTDGVVNEGLEQERAPRSAVGVKADGSAVFYTIDGRQPGYSVGATLTQVAQRLAELGCVEAVCLDGGGSTTFGVTWPDVTAMSVINRPSDGKQRANSNALFLVSDLPKTGVLDHFYVTPGDALLLAGSSVQMKTMGVDTNYLPMNWGGEMNWAIHNGDGMVTTDGLFTAGGESGVTRVTATAGAISGTAAITVVKTPDTVALTNETTGGAVTELLLEPNQTVDLKATAIYKKLTLGSQDTSYIWTADPAAGRVDENGLFTAAAASGKGYLTVSAGERSTTVPVTVTGHILPLEDFEESIINLIGTQSAQAESETDLDYVRFGRKSAKMIYDASAGTATLASTLAVKSGECFLTLWVYGDGSGNTLMASAADGDGNLTDVVLTGLDYTGWKQMTVALPTGTAAIRGFSVIYGGGESTGGTIWLDQLTTANELVTDTTAPVITMTVGQGVLTATVTDAMDQNLLQKNLTVMLDGVSHPFAWNAATAKLTATLPTDLEQLHRVTVTAADASGNLARSGHDFTAVTDWQEPFADMNGHWAQVYAGYLCQLGVTNGVQVGDALQFQPEKAISRGEFALMVARWQRLDLTVYDSVELPFADAADIPDWMLPAIKAMYAKGVMKGSREGDLLYAHAEAGISRMEAMTILGRIQAKGYPSQPLTFADADQVPSWALSHVQTLVAQGVVGGYENNLNPTSQVKRAEVAKMLVALM